ncbi:MAG: phenazine-specific anthranilate synthase [Rhodospirillales bacterium]|nr:phenazine-specific anthranilate synthase [Rhodospirillales bacterium]
MSILSPAALPAHISLMELLGTSSFAFLERDSIVYIILGQIVHLKTLEELAAHAEDAQKPVAFALPFHVIRERGFEAQGHEPIMAITGTQIYACPMAEFRALLPTHPLILSKDISASQSDADYAAMVRDFQEAEIEGGHCSQATLSRKFEGQIDQFHLNHALSLYRTLLFPQGQYMTVLFCDRSDDPDRPHCLIGATPERHLTITGEHALMIPIAGTLRKEDQETFPQRLGKFVADPKEINELFQVVDEELKMMGQICPEGGTIKGPYLREIGSVVHTEYELYGNRGLEPLDALRLTLHAPTVVGGPMESAARIIARYEPCSRRYYGGEIGLYAPASAAPSGVAELDCAITLRCGEFFSDGTFAIQAGGGLVRDSDPVSETHESRAKAMGLMAFLLGEPKVSVRYVTTELLEGTTPALQARNAHLSSFWAENQENLWRHSAKDAQHKTILIVNNEDDFAWMLAHVCRGLGYQVTVADTFEMQHRTITEDLVLLGPGPGDPNDEDHPRMMHLRSLTNALLVEKKPLLGVCLGHQMLAHCLGFPVKKQISSTQGMQRRVKVFGQMHNLGFYNSFAPVMHPIMDPPETISCDLDEHGRVIALHGPHYYGAQFHPESIMSETGVDLMKQMLEELLQTTS